ncbi:MAG TPA: fatty acid CoA ligase family protein [Planctomycetaceae bacterium]
MTTASLTEPPTDAPPSANIAERLRETARLAPDQAAVILPPRKRRPERRVTFAELDRDADRIARGVADLGVRPGHRIVLMVRPGIEFIALTFGLFRSGATVVLIDPGMGLRRVLRCLAEVDPDGFAAIPLVHAVRRLRRGLFPNARFNVCVGPNWFGDAVAYRDLLMPPSASRTPPRSSLLSLARGAGGEGSPSTPDVPSACPDTPLAISRTVTAAKPQANDDGEVSKGRPPASLTPDPSPQGEGDRIGEVLFAPPAVAPTDPAAIIFTSGGTGPPKGVVYEHGMFAAQVELLRERFDVRPGEVDLPGFPLFALFNAAMRVTTVVPDIDPTRPAKADPRKILDPIRRYGVTQAFGSPALWNRVGRHCERTGETIPHLKRALSAGAPVPLHVLKRMTAALAEPGADLHTPYGATEALPVATIAASEVLSETAERSRHGAGTCVGRPFPQVRVKILEITDGPIASLGDVRELPPGEIGEIVVSSPSATREYFRRPRETALAKIPDGDGFWHRMGDVGYLDGQGRLWFCGRKAHVVETGHGRMFSVCCEAIFNEHPDVYRSALVGIGPKGRQRPVIVVELEGFRGPIDADLRRLALANPLTERIDTFLYHKSFPVDVRHNIKIDRERLGRWAAKRLGVAEASR